MWEPCIKIVVESGDKKEIKKRNPLKNRKFGIHLKPEKVSYPWLLVDKFENQSHVGY